MRSRALTTAGPLVIKRRNHKELEKLDLGSRHQNENAPSKRAACALRKSESSIGGFQ